MLKTLRLCLALITMTGCAVGSVVEEGPCGEQDTLSRGTPWWGVPATEEADPCADGHMWLADAGHDGGVYALDPTGGIAIKLVEGLSASSILGPTELAEHAFVADFASGALLQFDLPSWEPDRVVFEDQSVLEEPAALLADGNQILMLGNDTGNLLRVDQESGQSAIVETGYLHHPHDIEWSGQGFVWIATAPRPRDGAWLVEISPKTGEEYHKLLPPDGASEATAVSLLESGALLVADYGARSVWRYELGHDDAHLFLGPDDLSGPPIDLVQDLNGTLMVLHPEGVDRFDTATGAFVSATLRFDLDEVEAPRRLFVSH